MPLMSHGALPAVVCQLLTAFARHAAGSNKALQGIFGLIFAGGLHDLS